MSRRTKRVVAVFVAVVFAILLGMIVWAATHPHVSRWVVLPDGTQVSLLNAEFPNPSVKIIGPSRLTLNRYDGGWRDWLYPKLPASVLARFGIRPISFSIVGANSLVVWLKFQHLPPPEPPGLWYLPRVRDAAGVEMPGIRAQFLGTNLAFCDIGLYPRRSGDFSVQICCVNGGFLSLGPSIPIHNPHPSIAPLWTAESLPTVRDTNGLSVTLAGLTTGMTYPLPGIAEDSVSRCYTRADLELTEDGRPATNWNVLYLTANAASGETLDCEASDRGWVDSRYAFIFPGALWSDEPAWDITAAMQRMAGFPPEELWVLKGIRLPARGVSISNVAITNVGGVLATFSSIKGRGPGQQVQNAKGIWSDLIDGSHHSTDPLGEIQDTNGSLLNGSSYRVMIQLVNSPPDDNLVLVSATDDLGRSIAYHEILRMGPNPVTATDNYACAFLVDSNAASINLTFAVTHLRFATFRVKPAVASTSH